MKYLAPILLSLVGIIGENNAVASESKLPEIKVLKAGGNVYMLQGAGGNIGVLATEEGLLLVDDQYAKMAKSIESSMSGISGKPLKFIVNTHFHGDHTGGNKYFSHKAPIFAHANVRKRLEQGKDSQKESLPVVTYKDGVEIFLDEEKIQLKHLPSGHTDGDTYVYFEKANVLHTGDLYFEVGFPYIDLGSGGSVKGYLANVRSMIANVPDDVTIIPGHGVLTDKQGLIAFADMIEFSIKKIEEALKQGKTEEQILSEGIGENYAHLSWSFITEERWLKTLIKDLS